MSKFLWKTIALALILMLVMVGCATKATPAPTPAPAPTPTSPPEPAPMSPPESEPTPAPEEESPEDMQYAANRLYELHNEDMPKFINEYHIVTYEDEESHEKFLVHEFAFTGGGGMFFMSSRILAENVAEAKTRIENAHWLANKSKLPTDIKPRDVKTDEIINEVNEATILLKQQETYSHYCEENDMKWAREHTDPGINNELTFKRIVATYYAYREALSKLITKLELVLSKLPASSASLKAS